MTMDADHDSGQSLASLPDTPPRQGGPDGSSGPASGSVRKDNRSSDSRKDDEPSAKKKTPRTRGSIACEPCRLRKVRCLGGVPCQACQSSGNPAHCHVRSKARPERSVRTSSSLVREPQPEQPGLCFPSKPAHPTPGVNLSSEIDKDLELAGLGFLRDIGRNPRPLGVIEDAIEDWCTSKGLDRTCINFQDSHPFAVRPVFQPDPSLETSLMAFFTQTTPAHTDVIDRKRVLALYSRYLAIRSSLTEDQLGLIHATVCRSADLNARGTNHTNGRRNGEMYAAAVYYYHLAIESLDRWDRPSLSAMAAYQLLVLFSYDNGGRDETLVLVEKLSWQVKALGLNKKDTASLYDTENQVDRMLTSFVYTDYMTSVLSDRPPQIPWSDIDWEPTEAAILAPARIHSMHLEADLLEVIYKRDLNDVGLILRTESKWVGFIKAMQQSYLKAKLENKNAFVCWALIRIYWLQILLRAPLVRHPEMGFSSMTILARACSQILRIHNDISQTGDFQPDWLQLRRVLTCSQITILAMSDGHLHPLEARELLGIGVDLIARCESVSHMARTISSSLQSAMDLMVDVTVPPNASQSTSQSETLPTHGSIERTAILPLPPITADTADTFSAGSIDLSNTLMMPSETLPQVNWALMPEIELDWQALLGDSSAQNLSMFGRQ